MNAPPPSYRYVGVLQPLVGAAPSGVVVDAVVVPMLLPHTAIVPSAGGGALVEAEGAGGPEGPARGSKAKAPQTYKTHYVCTGIDCGWSGSSRERHKKRRPDCPHMPCPMRFRVGEKVAPLVASFLARCTEAQRQQGMPPDGERAVLLSSDKVAAVIPTGCGPGDVFEFRIDRDRILAVTVPPEVDGRPSQAGDILEVEMPKKRKVRASDVKRAEERARRHAEEEERARQRRRWTVDDDAPQAPVCPSPGRLALELAS